jgi:energy-converting hydrogenase Eha subunit F
MNTRRHPRTLAEAWPQHYAWRGVITRYRAPLAERITSLVCTLATLATFAGIGVLLAWRG